jgi:Tol biopolymer transport system component
VNDVREMLERVGDRFDLPEMAFERFLRRRERKVRNQRLAAAVVAAAVSLVAITALIRAFSEAPNTGRRTPSPGQDTGSYIPAAFVDLRTGEATPLPVSVTSMPGATGFVASPSGTRLAFLARGASGSLEVHVATTDGRDIRQLTSGPGDAGTPRWSPDGLRIVYVRSSGSKSTLFMVRVFTGEQPQLSDPGEIWAPSFGPGGATVFFTHASGVQGYRPLGLWSQPMDGSDPSLIVANAAYGSISPDGTRIAYHRTRRGGTTSFFDPAISFIEAHGDVRNPPFSGTTGLPFFHTEGRWNAPVWSPDSSRIAYGDEAGNAVVMVVATRQLTTFRGREPSWVNDHTVLIEDYQPPVAAETPPASASPSGSTDRFTGLADLSLLDIRTGRTSLLPAPIRSIAAADRFQVSPDGERLAFDDGAYFYVSNLDGSNLRQMGVGNSPSWSPDGSQIAFVANGQSGIGLIELATQRVSWITDVGGEIYRPNFSADGQHILFTQVGPKWARLRTLSVRGEVEATLPLARAAFGTFSPDGSTIAYRKSDYNGDPTQMTRSSLWLADADGTGSWTLGSGGEAMSQVDPHSLWPMWSPSGDLIAYQPLFMRDVIVLKVASGRPIARIGGVSGVGWLDEHTLIITNKARE